MAIRGSSNNGPPLTVRQAQDKFVGANRRPVPAAQPPIASSGTVGGRGGIPNLRTAAAHSDAAQAAARLAVAHSQRAAILSRTDQRERRKK
jgi:hypothetical protein